MVAYEKLIDYLYEKGFAINGLSPYDCDECQDTGTHVHKLVERQKVYNNIMHEITCIKRCLISNNDAQKPIKPIDSYFDEQIYKIINNIVLFDKNHPLYGYKPFVDKLMVYYIENEQYEKCVAIKELSHV